MGCVLTEFIELLPVASIVLKFVCSEEVREAEALMRQEGIPYLDVTSKSVEELATTIMQQAKLVRRIY